MDGVDEETSDIKGIESDLRLCQEDLEDVMHDISNEMQQDYQKYDSDLIIMEETKTVEPDPAYLMEPIPDDEKQINELLQKESVRLNPSLFSFS